MAKNLTDENFINIQGWMITKLQLSGNELICYALIYGFSQDGESIFKGSSKYICDWLNVSKPTVFNILKKLCEKGLIQKIEKEVNGVRLCDYKAILPLVNKFNWGDKETLLGGSKKTLLGDSKEILPHNNILDNINNNNIKKENNDILESVNPEMKPIIEKWLKYKKERKESYKPTGLKGCIDKLIKISNNDSFIAEQIVDESISNNWSGLFPLKNNNTPKKESVWEHNMKIMQEMEEENRNVEQNLF